MEYSNSEAILTDYYRPKKDVFIAMIKKYKSQGKQVAIYGAGKKSRAFLQVVDCNGELFDCVYDRDENKQGQVMPTGQPIKSPSSMEADVIFVYGRAIEKATRQILARVAEEKILVNVDHIIWGNLNEDNTFFEPDLISSGKNTKIAAVTILYNPEENIFEVINSYVNQVDKLYLYDNSPIENQKLATIAAKTNNIEYIRGGYNGGIGIPINVVMKKALQEHFDWLITFDQDSVAFPGMVDAMREYVNCVDFDDSVGMVTPNFIDGLEWGIEKTSWPYLYYIYNPIQSGAMHRLSVLEKLGGYDEDLFIDGVDYEFDARLLTNDYKIVQINEAFLRHEINDNFDKVAVIGGFDTRGDQSPKERIYYRYRNALVLRKRYYDYPYLRLMWEDVLKNTHKEVEYFGNLTEYKEALAKAERDFKNNILGVYKV